MTWILNLQLLYRITLYLLRLSIMPFIGPMWAGYRAGPRKMVAPEGGS
jgi:hypothetical protein